MAKNNKSESRSKHIDIKYLAIRKHVKEKKMVIEHISTELMIADLLTKGMPPLKFKDHVVNMGLSSLMTIVLKSAPRLGAARRHLLAPRLKGGNAPSRRRRLSAQGARLRQGARWSPESPSRVRPGTHSSLSFSFFFFFFFFFFSLLPSSCREEAKRRHFGLFLPSSPLFWLSQPETTAILCPSLFRAGEVKKKIGEK
ncbi:hypothetical protein CK203_073701 [Vitis vinifera]|uniref:Copia protein n=1 Tax=Vitis vinifera TaxID=29760 RepID=A0A438EIH4_VITVI|nr:hypothetical protein CK203_073701 [Vitis vinifera]